MIQRTGQQPINQGHNERENGQTPEKSIGPKQSKLNEGGSECHEDCKQDAASAGIGRGLRVGNHEEGEDEQSSVLQPMHWDGQRLTQPPGTSYEQSSPGKQEGERNIGSRCPEDDKSAEANHQKDEESKISPLPG